MLQLDAIYKAAHVLKEVVRRTDLIYAPQINPESTVYLKPENLQLTGSFKVRGAYYMRKGWHWLPLSAVSSR